MSEPIDFFVSYTGRDVAWATWVAHRLEVAGYRVLVQAWDFAGGNFIVQMEDAIQRAPRLVAILSDSYLGSKWGRQEWAAYLKVSDAAIIPVQIEGISRRTILGALARINLIGLGEQEAEKKLLGEIKKFAGLPGRAPLDRLAGNKSSFPGIGYRIAADPVVSQDEPETAVPPAPVDRDHIQLILLGDGDEAAITSFRMLLDVAPERCCDMFGSDLDAAAQLDKVAEVIQDLDIEAVSDVLVVFAGTGSSHSDAGVRLHVRATDPAHTANTSIDLAALLEHLQDDHHGLRNCVILDAIDKDGQPVGPTQPAEVPVLNLGHGDHGGGDLARITEALGRPLKELPPLPHCGPLSLADLRDFANGDLVAYPNSAAYQIGLVPSPLAWPQTDRTDPGLSNWCAVISEADGHTPDDGDHESVALVIDKLAEVSLNLLEQAYEDRSQAIQLTTSPGTLLAGDVLSSPRAFAHAVEQVCCAEFAIFDLTNYEPAVMILLGIRAVIRRGVTVCLAGNHDPLWQDSERPFHLREISLVTPPGRETVESRILEGIKQLVQPGSNYNDLPCFDLIRAVPLEPEQRQTRAFDAKQNPSILALVPFDPYYWKRNWKQIKESLPATARNKTVKASGGTKAAQQPALLRTLDLDSPRVVSAQLFEAIRLTDFCLVDVTTARPNVLFELGVRLAANRLHPVVIVDLTYGEAAAKADPDSAEAKWLSDVDGQLAMLRRLFQPVQYTPKLPPAFTQMVDRHLEFRRLLLEPEDPRAQSLLGGLPPTGIYDLAWQHAVYRHEVVTRPVAEYLQAGGEALLVNPTAGQRHLIYPTRHPLTDAAEQTGLEYLLAAWLYLHFRKQAGESTDEALTEQYQALWDRLTDLLDQTGKPADKSFFNEMENWLAADGGPV